MPRICKGNCLLADAQREIRLQVPDPGRRQVAGDFTGPLSEDGHVLWRMTGRLRRQAGPFRTFPLVSGDSPGPDVPGRPLIWRFAEG